MKTTKKQKTKPKPKKKLKKKSQPVKELYTLPEAAEFKGVTRQAVWQAVTGGRLTAQKFGNFFLVSHQDLLNWSPSKVKV